MNVAEVPYSKRKNAPGIRVWSGLNRTQAAADGEVIDCLGIGTQMWPALNVRAGRTRIGEWERATDVYETDGHMIVIDDNKLYYDGAFKTNVGGTKKQFAEINRKLVIWPDKVYINLNTGEIGHIEAEIAGSVTMRDGGILVVTNSNGTGVTSFSDVSGWYYETTPTGGQGEMVSYTNTYFRTYENLTYSNGWAYTSAQTGDIYSGMFFIGAAPQTSYNQHESNWSMEGTVYGKVTKVTTTEKPWYDDWGHLWGESKSVTVEYELFDAAGLDLGKQFVAGDTIALEGNALEYNNRESIGLKSVGKNQLVVDDVLVGHANYYNVTAALEPKAYRLIYSGSSSGTQYGDVFRPQRTIRAGEQLFMVWSDAPQGGLKDTGVYAYDPKTKELEFFAQTNDSTYTDLDAKNNAYDLQSGASMTITRKVPEMDFICEHNNRLYGVSNAEEEKIYNAQTGQYETVTSRVLHASALGQPTRWNVFEGAATDSYAVAVAGEGDFTGIISYSGNVIAFKESKMYKLSGDYPAEFYLRSYTVDGVKEGCHKSLAIINEVLYFLSPYGVMSYSGGVPALISYNLDLLKFRDAVAGRDRTRYYISMEDPDNGYMIYSYDTVRGVWVIESKEQATGIERVGDYAYACIGGKIYKLADEGSQETVRWEATLPETDEGAFEKKRYQYMALIADVDGSLTVKCRQNDHKEWKVLGTITEKGKKIHRLPMDTIRCDRIQFKLEGEGKTTIWAMERRFTVGSER